MSTKLELSPEAQLAARAFVDKCLEITDGSQEAGLRRIGTQQYEETVNKVLEALPIGQWHIFEE